MYRGTGGTGHGTAELSSHGIAESTDYGSTPDALFHLGLMYCVGRDVELDLVEAHKWFNLAAHARQRRRQALSASRFRARCRSRRSRAHSASPASGSPRTELLSSAACRLAIAEQRGDARPRLLHGVAHGVARIGDGLAGFVGRSSTAVGLRILDGCGRLAPARAPQAASGAAGASSSTGASWARGRGCAGRGRLLQRRGAGFGRREHHRARFARAGRRLRRARRCSSHGRRFGELGDAQELSARGARRHGRVAADDAAVARVGSGAGHAVFLRRSRTGGGRAASAAAIVTFRVRMRAHPTGPAACGPVFPTAAETMRRWARGVKRDGAGARGCGLARLAIAPPRLY